MSAAVFLLVWLGAAGACGLLLLLRNEIVYAARTKAILVAHGKVVDGDRDAWKSFDAFGSYHQMLWQVWKWRYSQFYPGWQS